MPCPRRPRHAHHDGPSRTTRRLLRGRRTLIDTDSAGGTHDFVARVAQRGQWLFHSVGMTVTDAIHQHIPKTAWTPAVEKDGDLRADAWVAELTGDVLTG
ncbi:transposase [Streptomyces lincolnensis]|uniref:Transposase n=1 Tax=Streptomyces lincolnensis TaxID=1915 RepID=A0A1B1MPF0_STRLN|nr:transposase [Streptomyces lincolnensis]